MASSSNPYENYNHPSVEDEDDLIDPDDADLDDLDDPLHPTNTTSSRSPLTGNITTSNSARPLNENYLTSRIPGEDRRAPTNTLDESVWETLRRDLLAVWSKMREVLYPKYLFGGSMLQNTTSLRGAYENLRSGGVSGARDEIVGIAGRAVDADVLLSQGNMRGDQKTKVFSGVFAMVWIGEAVVTLQIKLLGGEYLLRSKRLYNWLHTLPSGHRSSPLSSPSPKHRSNSRLPLPRSVVACSRR
ncbi:hypothetical protein B7494_g631 [Chlorociboria aeruginascens]|nr:hypothetical protein B7494_g631 [Chlorociboria aeruginascens]